ncbi:MAG: putative host-nuclease inhibitor protein Gam [Magnetococcales bacterium]|nr:putative host-nuclease inhibitor protein Gam [Magnetococcales bacterium]
MATGKRIKPKVAIVIQNLEHANTVLAEIGGLQRQIDAAEMEANCAIDKIKEGALEITAPSRDRIKALSEALATFGASQKSEHFTEKRTIELVFGFIGFRKSNEIKAAAGKKLADVLEALKVHRILEAVKVTEKINKDAMRDWTDERLALVYAVREEKDTFWYEIKAEAVQHG